MNFSAQKMGGWRKTMLLSTVALFAFAGTAVATPKKTSTDEKIDLLQQQIKVMQQQILDLKSSQASKYAEVRKSVDELPKVSFEAGRPTFKSGDGNFSASLRALVQFDAAYYSQRGIRTQQAPDLNSGSNFRRVRIGIDGALYKNWQYSFIGEYGGSGSEQPVGINTASLQYSGLKPVYFKVGAFTPYVNLEDSESAADTLFLERASATEITRNIAGGDAREGIQIWAQGDRYLASVAFTGTRVANTAGAAPTFDEQEGVVGRLAGLAYTDANTNLVVGTNGSYIFDLSQSAANTDGGSITFSNSPELRVDDTGTGANVFTGASVTAQNGSPASLISTGGIAARRAWHWGLDAAAQWKAAYAEGGYYQFGAVRNDGGLAGSNPEFSAWYAELAYTLTGESRRYNAANAAFRTPKVAYPFNFGKDAGWGAWELAARYSYTDLNFAPGVARRPVPNSGSIRGGIQEIWTIGLNWYPNDALRFSLNYLNADINRLNASGLQIGPSFSALALRSQWNF